ncbi:MAG: histidine kinase [Bacteroidota bacterium]
MRIVNLISLIGMVVGGLFLILNIFQFPTDYGKHASMMITILLLAIIIVFNYRHLYHAARVFLITFTLTMFAFNANVTFQGFQSEYQYLIVPLLSLFFFDNRWLHYTSLALAIILFYVPDFFLHIYPIHERLNALWIFPATFAVVNYFKRLNQRNEAVLASQKQLEVGQMQHRMLRSQLNPHFISNSMVAIQNSLLNNDVESAEVYLTTFSRLMRQILENSRREVITMEEEVSMLKDYLEVNKKRLQDRFHYHITISESIDPELDTIPPMMIQPFVENAIEHGIAPKEENLRVDITFSKGKSGVQVIVKDNGGGLKETKAQSSKESLSTQIIKERLALFDQSLKEKINLIIENWEDEEEKIGVKVMLTLPLKT